MTVFADRTKGALLPATDQAQGALRGLRVVDFGWAWAGAICGQVLADFGAEVIKIESRSRLDPMRQGRPIVGTEPDPEQNPVCHNVNRNKFSFGVNVKDPEGVRLVRELVAHADIVVENMTPRALPKIGLGYEDLRAVNPALIMVSLPGVANDGPLSEVRSYGPVVSAMSGLDGLTGYDGEEPMGFQQPIPDPNVGLHAAVAVLAALRYRKLTGEGQYILMSQLRAMIPMLGEAVSEYALTKRVPGPSGHRRRGFGPHGIYPSLGEDKWLSVAVRTDEEWRGLCRALGRPDLLDDPRYSTLELREVNRAPLDEAIAAWASQRSPVEATSVLQSHGVASAPCLDVGERFQDPHFTERNDVVLIEHPVLGTTFVYGSPWRTSAEHPPSVWKRVPLLGEDTDAVLGQILGLDNAEIARLRAAGVVE